MLDLCLVFARLEATVSDLTAISDLSDLRGDALRDIIVLSFCTSKHVTHLLLLRLIRGDYFKMFLIKCDLLKINTKFISTCSCEVIIILSIKYIL